MGVENSITAKFGGSSMADASAIRKAASIVEADPNRKVIVVSAPGKNQQHPTKVTDLLLMGEFRPVEKRFLQLSQDLSCPEVKNWLDEVRVGMNNSRSRDWIASRGEWIQAQLFAQIKGFDFVDASEILHLSEDGRGVTPESYDLICARAKAVQRPIVVPGFYGVDRNGEVQTFARGGSDISGAILARGTNARLYENWTDVNGLMAADPRIVKNPRTIPTITYQEMRELGYRGADVLQRDTILPVFEAGIPINIKNTFNPSHPGTLIVKKRRLREDETVIGIAGRGGFSAIQIEKFGMNEDVGIGDEVLKVFRQLGISFEHDTTGLDVMSVIVSRKHLNGHEATVKADLIESINPTKISILWNLGLICLVGQGISYETASVLRKISETLERKNFEIVATSISTLRNNIVIGVKDQFLNRATRALYQAFYS